MILVVGSCSCRGVHVFQLMRLASESDRAQPSSRQNELLCTFLNCENLIGGVGVVFCNDKVHYWSQTPGDGHISCRHRLAGWQNPWVPKPMGWERLLDTRPLLAEDVLHLTCSKSMKLQVRHVHISMLNS